MIFYSAVYGADMAHSRTTKGRRRAVSRHKGPYGAYFRAQHLTAHRYTARLEVGYDACYGAVYGADA